MTENNPDPEKSDFEQVLREESQRGTRQPNRALASSTRGKRLRQMRKLLTTATEAEFLSVLRAAGMSDDSPELRAALQAWREYRS